MMFCLPFVCRFRINVRFRKNVGGIGNMASKSLWLLLVAMSLSLGCSGSDDPNRPKTYPVSGTVKLNGTAVEGATVTFQLIEGKENAIGLTDQSGKYTLSTFRPNDGAVAGQYKVSISKFDLETPNVSSALTPGKINSGDLPADYAAPSANSGGGKGRDTGPKNSLPAKYAKADSSALRALVDPKGGNKFDFDLK